jgi:hypothetical protein
MIQVIAVIPSTVSGNTVPVTIQAGNTASQAGVTIAVAGNPAFAITSQEIVGSVVVGSAGLTCSAPPAKSTFSSSDPVVWVYFTYNGAQTGDLLTANWLHPSGQVDAYQPSLALSSSGSGCAAAPLTIASGDAGQDPGSWQVKLFRNGAFEFALPFTIVP